MAIKGSNVKTIAKPPNTWSTGFNFIKEKVVCSFKDKGLLLS